MKKTLLILAMAGALTACGGSSSDDASNGGTNPPPTSKTKTGVFTDGEISGVSYQTSSGLKGTTTEKGEFSFNEGDKVTFSIGKVQLGDSTAAKARVTPLDLSTDNNVRDNLLVFLQSLDANSKHDDGIQINKNTVTLLETINPNLKFTQPADKFVNDPVFTQIIEQTGTTIVTPELAKENFKQTFYKDIAGVWQLSDGKVQVLLHIDGNGNYTLGQAAPRDDAGQSGVEAGNLGWNATTGKLNPAIQFDKNGEWGLSHPEESGHFLSYGTENNTLSLKEGEAQYIFKKVPNQANSLVGSWQMPDHIISFFSDNSYFLLYTGVYDGVENDCADRGVEYGKYSATGNTLEATEIYYDTTGCSGLVDSYVIGDLISGKYDLDLFKLTLKQDQLTIQYENEEPGVYQRIK
ncbi:hypothetical protein ACF3NA_07240 [Alkanindiges sp. WGS2144]|uniref:hypothetical protein n=1 Tax=Alkanindiges sp. WGS2144 TaxID=3366808 RepID=UPI003751481D